MKVLLIRLNSVPFPVPPPDAPLGLLYVAAALEGAGHGVVVRDLNWQKIEPEIWDQIGDGEIGAVGISMLSFVRAEGYRIIRRVKELNPGVMVMVGGIHATVLGKQVLGAYPADACVVGEGEATAVELVGRWARGESLVGCSGAWVRGGDYNPRPLLDIDSIPFPAWSHTDLSKFTMTCTKSFRPGYVANGIQIDSVPWAPIIASRGCVGRCTFCNAWKHWGGKVRSRSASAIVAEMALLNMKYGVRLFAFNDDAFPLRRQQMVDMCELLINSPYKFAWQTTTRADTVDDELCELMKAAGCFMVAVGIESGSQTIHNGLKKHLDLERAKAGMDSIRRSGMALYPLLMVGNPGETEETIKETVKYVNDARPYFYSYVTGVMIVPGTDLCYLAGIEDGFWTKPDTDGLPYYLKENSLEELTHYSNMIQSGVKRCQ